MSDTTKRTRTRNRGPVHLPLPPSGVQVGLSLTVPADVLAQWPERTLTAFLLGIAAVLHASGETPP